MSWSRVRHERKPRVGGALTLVGRCRSDTPLGSCRVEPGVFAEFRIPRIPVQTPPHSGGTQTILLRRASSSAKSTNATTEERVALSTSAASARSFAW